VGYAGWGPGQLDREIEEDAWWMTEMDVMEILAQPHEQRWGMVMDQLGLNGKMTGHYKV
ncbi:MAG: YqgE/AlgH family protein, partial [Gammaproteobacteria bacterium]|nr:YqgE/AlgH family protein [Gammaproteobacteria bacterium]